MLRIVPLLSSFVRQGSGGKTSNTADDFAVKRFFFSFNHSRTQVCIKSKSLFITPMDWEAPRR